MTEVNPILEQMKDVTKPQRKFLVALFATILTVRGKVNFFNLSRYSDYSEKSFRRQFRRRFDFMQFNLCAVSKLKPSRQPFLVGQDASFIPKSGKRTYGLEYFFNGCASRAERGLEVSLVSLIDLDRHQAFAVSARQTPDSAHLPDSLGVDPKSAQAAELTRIDFYLAHLKQAKPLLPAGIGYGVFDGAYAKTKFVDGVCALGLHLISKLRADANLRYLYTGERKTGRGLPRLYDGKVAFNDLSRFEPVGEVETGLHLYTALVSHVSLKRRIRIVVLVDRSTAGRERFAVLFSTDCEQDAKEIYEFYKARFQLEFLFRDAKQFTGLSDCQARDAQALDFHFNASLTTVNLAKIEALQNNQADEPIVFSLSSIKQRAFNQHFLEMIIEKLALEQSAIKNHPDYDYIRSYGAIAT